MAMLAWRPARAPAIGQPQACYIRVSTVAGIASVMVFYLMTTRAVKNIDVTKWPVRTSGLPIHHRVPSSDIMGCLVYTRSPVASKYAVSLTNR
jgi:hypothetical protein